MAKNVLKHAELVALGDKLRAVCKPDKDKDGRCTYEEGWSDQRLVDEANGTLTVHNVAGLRTAILGNLIAPKAVDPVQEALERTLKRESVLIARLDALEALVLRLIEQQDRFFNWASKRPVSPLLVGK